MHRSRAPGSAETGLGQVELRLILRPWNSQPGWVLMLLKLAACAQGMNGLRALDTTWRWLDFILKVLGSHQRL